MVQLFDLGINNKNLCKSTLRVLFLVKEKAKYKFVLYFVFIKTKLQNKHEKH